MHRDVGDVHRLQRKLEYQKALIESVLDAAPVVVALIDRDGKVPLDNQEYKKLLGDLRGQEPAELLVSAMTRSAGTTLAKAADARRELKDIEVRLDTAGAGRPRWLSCSGTWIGEPDPAASTCFEGPGKRRACLLLLATDITEQRREHERARTCRHGAGDRPGDRYPARRDIRIDPEFPDGCLIRVAFPSASQA